MSSDWSAIPCYRTGRNFVRVGDIVKCKPHQGVSFKAQVARIEQRDTDGEIQVTVVGGSYGVKQWRTFFANRITRLAQNRLENLK